VDLRAQASFDYYMFDKSRFPNVPDDVIEEQLQDGRISLVQSETYPIYAQATRAGVNGATTNLFGGLRLPIYLDVSAISLLNVKVNDAIKDNYSLVMSRRVLGSQPATITVYAADKTTVLCNDYYPETYSCH